MIIKKTYPPKIGEYCYHKIDNNYDYFFVKTDSNESMCKASFSLSENLDLSDENICNLGKITYIIPKDPN